MAERAFLVSFEWIEWDTAEVMLRTGLLNLCCFSVMGCLDSASLLAM